MVPRLIQPLWWGLPRTMLWMLPESIECAALAGGDHGDHGSVTLRCPSATRGASGCLICPLNFQICRQQPLIRLSRQQSGLDDLEVGPAQDGAP
jgi:hypothetical protein